MESAIKAGAAYGIPKDMTLLKKPSGDSCIDCIKGKQKRKSHQAADKKTKPRRIFKPGEKIHIDTKKFEVTGIGNYTYWLSIVEDASGAEIGCPTKGRTAIEILDILDRKRKWLRLKTGNELQEIQCDGAKEFVEGIANDKNWAGVTISSSSAHSPEENGRAERMNQTRSNTSITLLSQSRLDKRFWPFSERMAATHINYTGRRRKNAMGNPHRREARLREYSPIWLPCILSRPEGEQESIRPEISTRNIHW